MARWSHAPAAILAIAAGLVATILIAISLPPLSAVAQSVPENSADPYAGLPSWLPRPVVPADNPLTPEKVELGRRLFFEGSRTSCVRCHQAGAVGGLVGPDLTHVAKDAKKDRVILIIQKNQTFLNPTVVNVIKTLRCKIFNYISTRHVKGSTFHISISFYLFLQR